MPSFTFADIIAPVSEEEFFAEYYDRKPLHVRGTPEKFAEVMSWQHLNDVLNMTHIWSSKTLNLVQDCVPVPAEAFCKQAQDRDGRPVLQPDAGKVLTQLRRGASLVLNDIDSLTAGLASVSNALEDRLKAKAQANLYCSWRQHKAFPPHYDTHDVYAVHVEGTKTWNVYSGRADHPIAHPLFKGLPQSHHEQAKGELLMEVALQPGDLLYLPRGQYHDALASTDAVIHVAFGAHHPLGMDLMNLFYDRVAYEQLFRRPLPRIEADGGEEALRAHMKEMGARLAELAEDPAVVEAFAKFVREYRFPRGGFNLPALDASPRYAVAGMGLRVVRRGRELAVKTPSGMVPIPQDAHDIVAWVLSRERFSEAELEAAFASAPAEQRERVIGEMARAQLIQAA